MPNKKFEYYGLTNAAIEFAADEYTQQFISLLQKYVEHVRQSEGIDFIDRIGDAQSSNVVFTER